MSRSGSSSRRPGAIVNGARDALMIDLAWQRGMRRGSELCQLTWDDVRGGRHPDDLHQAGEGRPGPLQPVERRAFAGFERSETPRSPDR